MQRPSARRLRRRNCHRDIVAYRQAEAVFRAFYFGRPFDLATIRDRPSAGIVEQHWSTLEQLAEALQRKKELSREQVTLPCSCSPDAPHTHRRGKHPPVR